MKRTNHSNRFSESVFEALEGRTLCSVYLVTSPYSGGPGSFREAIALSNSSVNVRDTIRFQIPSFVGETITIRPTIKLPTITDPVTITGQQQSGYQNRPLIEIDGSACTSAGANGLTIATNNSLVLGLAFDNFDEGAGIRITGNANGVHNCYLGIRPVYSEAKPNLWGVHIDGGSGNVIGKNGDRGGNVISGNLQSGVIVTGTTGSHNTIRENLIGTNGDGITPLANGADGVFLGAGVTGTLVSANTISGNSKNGVHIYGANYTIVEMNNIGVGRDWKTAVSNRQNGVRIANNGHHNTIGMVSGFERNRIAWNWQNGICVVSGTSNKVRVNEIFNNSKLGIDLGDDGLTPNDPGDIDGGANRLLNTPTITEAYANATSTYVRMKFDGAPNATYEWELFRNRAPNALTGPEGGQYVGRVPLTTNASGHYENTISFGANFANQFLSSTLTDPAGNTSEISGAVHVRNDKPGVPTMTIDDAVVTEGNSGTKLLTLTVKLSAPLTSAVSYDWTSTGATAKYSLDFLGGGTRQIPAGVVTDMFTVKIVGDTIPETAERFFVTLSPSIGTQVKVTKFRATVTILDNDGAAVAAKAAGPTALNKLQKQTLDVGLGGVAKLIP